MPVQLAILVFQLVLKMLPILYQFKLLKDEATLKELQRRFETAIRQAEANALDSSKLRQQHEANKDELRVKRDKVWGKPVQAEPVMTLDPAKPVVAESFVVSVSGVVDAPEIIVDDAYSFGLAVQSGSEYKKPLVLNTGGERRITAKVKGQVVASAVIRI